MLNLTSVVELWIGGFRGGWVGDFRGGWVGGFRGGWIGGFSDWVEMSRGGLTCLVQPLNHNISLVWSFLK